MKSVYFGVFLSAVIFASCNTEVGNTQSSVSAGVAGGSNNHGSNFEDTEAEGNCSGKVLVCHIPPGNSDAAHIISIAAPAVQPHVSLHGDYVVGCEGEGSVSAGDSCDLEPDPGNGQNDDDGNDDDGNDDPGIGV